MELKKISDLLTTLQNYGKRYEPGFHDTDMTKEERLFVSALIQYYKPHNILEVGVAGGGGSANILNTIQDMDDTALTSIDIARVFQHPFQGPVEVGQFVREAFPDLPNGKWNLLVGKDPAERMEALHTSFDFVILDTAHVHPIESLNFLSILPYLSEQCIVVLHDITVYMDVLRRTNDLNCFATGMLMSAICADKLLPDFKSYHGFTNIAALQLSADTRKYLRNVFDLLMLPWEYIPDSLASVAQFVNSHYPDELKKIFWQAVELNLEVYIQREQRIPDSWFSWMQADCPIFYGAGNNMKKILALFPADTSFNPLIWDKNASSIAEIGGYAVTEPDFLSVNKAEKNVIITIEDDTTFHEIYEKLKGLGYWVFHGLYEYLFSLLAGGVLQ